MTVTGLQFIYSVLVEFSTFYFVKNSFNLASLCFEIFLNKNFFQSSNFLEERMKDFFFEKSFLINCHIFNYNVYLL